MLRVELETSLQSLSDRRFCLSCHTLPSDAPEACLSNTFPVPVLQGHFLVLFQEPGVPLRFLLVLISTPQCTGGTYSWSILRLHSTGSLHLLFSQFLSQLSSPSPNGRQTLTQERELVGFSLFCLPSNLSSLYGRSHLSQPSPLPPQSRSSGDLSCPPPVAD